MKYYTEFINNHNKRVLIYPTEHDFTKLNTWTEHDVYFLWNKNWTTSLAGKLSFQRRMIKLIKISRCTMYDVSQYKLTIKNI